MEYQNILIIKMSSVGDVLHALPTAAAIRDRFPAARISWLVHPQFAAFVPEPPIIDEIIYFDKVAFKKMSWSEKWHFVKEFRAQLHAKHFDLVIDLQGLFKSGAVAFLTGCANKIGYCEMREGSNLVSEPIVGEHAEDHVIERYLDVARYLGAEVRGVHFPLPDLSQERSQIRAMLTAAGIKLVQQQKDIFGHIVRGKSRKATFPVLNAQGGLVPSPYVVLAIGARWETKKWPQEHFAKLGRMLIDDGYAVVLLGGKEDIRCGEIVRELANFPKEMLDLTGKTTLRQAAALIDDSVFYVSADTGPLHIATALKKPLVALYGPTKPNRTGPYGDRWATVIVSPMECRGCLKKQCNNWHCMYKITPEYVYDIIKKKMEAQHG